MSVLYNQYFKGGLNKSSATELPKSRRNQQIETERYERLTRGESTYAPQGKHHSTSRYTEGGHARRSLDYQATYESTTLSTTKNSRTHAGSQLPAGMSRSGIMKSQFNMNESSQSMSQSNEIVHLDKLTVRDIINACTDSIQHTEHFIGDATQDEDNAALAYAKLQHLYQEFTEQFDKKRPKENISA